MDIMPGDIFFTMDNSLISRAIRLVETGKFNMQVPSHCGIIEYLYFDNDKMKIHTIEALYTGVKRSTLHKRRGKVWIARMNGLRDIQAGIKWIKKQVGIRYDYLQLIGILIRAFLRVLRLKKNYLNNLGRLKFICSELLESYAMRTDGRLWHGNIGYVTPYDLFRSKEITIYQTP